MVSPSGSRVRSGMSTCVHCARSPRSLSRSHVDHAVGSCNAARAATGCEIPAKIRASRLTSTTRRRNSRFGNDTSTPRVINGRGICCANVALTDMLRPTARGPWRPAAACDAVSRRLGPLPLLIPRCQTRDPPKTPASYSSLANKTVSPTPDCGAPPQPLLCFRVGNTTLVDHHIHTVGTGTQPCECARHRERLRRT